MIEVNNSGDCKGNWSYAEYSVVKKKVTQIGIQMKDRGKQPGDVVIVPGI